MLNTFKAALYALAIMLTATAASAAGKTHFVAIHVDQNNPKLMNMALNNVQNIKKYYKAKGDKVKIEVVAYGPGLHMLRKDTSPVADRIAVIGMSPDVKFSACGNTHRKMSKKTGKKVQLLNEAKLVPSGVVQLITLQEKGYTYIRP